MVKSELQVYARVKPNFESSSGRQVPYIINKSRNRIEINVSRTKMLSNAKDSFEFGFSRVFDKESTQEDLFEGVARPVI